MFLLPSSPVQRAVVGTTVALLLATLLLLRSPAAAQGLLWPVVALVVLVAAAFVVVRSRRRASGWAAAARGGRDLVLHLSPVVLLTLVFPFASSRLAGADIGGTPLTTVLLASSLTVPWLSQAVCLPLYRAIGHLILEGDLQKIEKRFCATWPWTFVQTLPAVVLFVVPVQLFLRFSPSALAGYVVLCLLHVLFAQSLILTNVGRRRGRWALAWAVYAAALAVAPTWWFLPPLAGLAVQVLPLARELASLRRPPRLDHRDVAADLVRGILLGAVLWSDKLFLFVVTDGRFAVQTVFLALLPAVLAYNFYFVRLAPSFDDSVGVVRASMESDPYSVLAHRSRSLADLVTSSVATTGLLGAVLGLVVTLLAATLAPADLQTVGLVSLASWTFMMITILCYKLDYVGRRAAAQAISAVHLVLCTVVFLTVSGVGATYGLLVALDAAVFVLALAACLLHWRNPEYTLFWRHATAW
ncbi:hypothetical protein [Kineococcus rubinsiae]|uniref:hypothetical protein n=1 Tax=Kineococcus rubinsiae TaxID=2609562 RepID=UPI00142FD1DF|nr:hypothetical protein [Kineococcus rubinsiae]NIZ92085.1 hypothetical protein [Kineococcus rubinsiae]